MVVACRTRQLLNTSKSISFSGNLHLSTLKSTLGLPCKNLFQQPNNRLFRLCDFRYFHTSREPRSSFAKLTPQEITAVASFEASVCKQAGWSCQNCNTMKYCMSVFGTLSNWQQTSCVDMLDNKGKPFCDPTTNKCTTTPSAECDPLLSFQCVRDGNFPDVNNCTKYVSCKKGVVEILHCANGQIYNHKYGKCVLKLDEADCLKGLCTNNAFAAYPSDPSVYVQCKSNMAVLKSCSLASESFDLASKTCTRSCEVEAAVSANTRNCRSYFSCSSDAATNKGFALDEKVCSKGGFNSATLKCQNSFAVLCNELVLLDGIYQRVIPSFIRNFFIPIKNVLRDLNISPVVLLMNFGLKETTINSAVLLADYVVTKRKIPPAIISSVVKLVLNIVPGRLRSIVEFLLNTFLGIQFKNLASSQLIIESPDVDLEALALRLEHEKFLPIAKELAVPVRSSLNVRSAPEFFQLVYRHVPESVETVNAYAENRILDLNNGIARFNAEEVIVLLKTQLQAFHNSHLCRDNYLVCQVVLKAWTQEHSKQLVTAITDLSVPVSYEQVANRVKGDEGGDLFEAIVRVYADAFSKFLRQILMLENDVVDSLIGTLQGLLRNPFVRFMLQQSGVYVDDFIKVLFAFQKDVNTFMLSTL